VVVIVVRFANPITVLVCRRAVDAFGDGTAAATFAVTGCATAQQAAEEKSGDFRQDSTTRLRLMAPAGADLRAGDEIVLPTGERFRIDGSPSVPVSPFTGWRPGIVADLERVTG
jgi:hypothetical protein